MTKYIMPAGALLVLALYLAPVPGQTQGQTQAQTPAAPRKIEILFLGHNSPHHNSAKFEPMLKDALASEPFNFTYTADPKDLNDANLAKYDELMIYANHTKIEPEQEKALLDFVAGGERATEARSKPGSGRCGCRLPGGTLNQDRFHGPANQPEPVIHRLHRVSGGDGVRLRGARVDSRELAHGIQPHLRTDRLSPGRGPVSVRDLDHPLQPDHRPPGQWRIHGDRVHVACAFGS